MHKISLFLPNEKATFEFASLVSGLITGPCFIYLHGELGVGKTTFARGLLRHKGYTGTVKSPTYTLIETYPFEQYHVHHLDLYRLSEPEELEFLGLRDLMLVNDIFIIEWPQRCKGWLPLSDLDISLIYKGTGREAVIQTKVKNALFKKLLSTINNSREI